MSVIVLRDNVLNPKWQIQIEDNLDSNILLCNDMSVVVLRENALSAFLFKTVLLQLFSN